MPEAAAEADKKGMSQAKISDDKVHFELFLHKFNG